MWKTFAEQVGIVLVCCVIVLAIGFVTYACEVQPVEECMDHGRHSFTYCYKLLNKD